MSVNFNNITKGTLDGDGWFDRYLRATRVQLDEAVKNNEITQEIYGQVLSAGIGPMMQQATEFELKRETTDAEIAIKYAELAIREAELKLKEQELELAKRGQEDKEATSAQQRELVVEQINETKQNVLSAERKVDSWDDNMLMKVTEMQANVASFFVNAAAEDTGPLLSDLKEMMQIITSRADEIVGTQYPLPST